MAKISTRIVVTGKEETHEGRMSIADVSLQNQEGKVKVSGTARFLAA